MEATRSEALFRALADPTRLRIVALLRDGACCVGDLVEALEVPQPRASRHLAHLRAAGLVAVERVGSWAIYAVPEGLDPARAAVVAALDACRARDPALARDRDRAARVRATGGCCPHVAARGAGTEAVP